MKKMLIIGAVLAVSLPLLITGCASTCACKDCGASRTECKCDKRADCACKGDERRADCSCPTSETCPCK